MFNKSPNHVFSFSIDMHNVAFIENKNNEQIA